LEVVGDETKEFDGKERNHSEMWRSFSRVVPDLLHSERVSSEVSERERNGSFIERSTEVNVNSQLALPKQL